MATLSTLSKNFTTAVMLFVAKVTKTKMISMFGVTRFAKLQLYQLSFLFLFLVTPQCESTSVSMASFMNPDKISSSELL